VTEESGTLMTHSQDFNREAVNRKLTELEGALRAFLEKLAKKNVGVAQYEIKFYAEARYLFQIWELEVECPTARIDSDEDEAALLESFHRAHERIFSVRDEEGAVEFLNWRGRLAVSLDKPAMLRIPEVHNDSPDRQSVRKAYFGDGLVDTPVFKGTGLIPGAVIAGPAIIEEPTTTIVVYPQMTARVTALHSYLISTQQEMPL
jgi:N-methylhydantoinase A